MSPLVSQIEDGLYHGGLTRADDLDDVDVVVNVHEDPDPPEFSRFKMVVWSPVNDNQYPGHDWLETITDFIAACRKHKQRVFVHCAFGISRSSLVVCAFLMKEHGWSLEQALEYMMSRRKLACPARQFLEGLMGFEKDRLKHVGDNSEVPSCPTHAS